MDIDPPKHYPKFVGILLALFVPGMTHVLTGRRTAGLVLFITVTLLPVAGTWIAVLPNPIFIYSGLLLLAAATPALSIYILITSWRRIDHMPGRKWAAVIGSILLLSMLNGILERYLPVHPHKISAGSMEPTLMGIHTHNNLEKMSFFDRLISGRYSENITAFDSGPVSNIEPLGDGLAFHVGKSAHWLPNYAATNGLKSSYKNGESIWKGTVILGDHILTDHYTYLFRQPERGDIVTFSTSGIDHPDVQPARIYVSRIVGLPGETISIRDGKIMVNGSPANTPAIFQTLEYTNAGQLDAPENTITLGTDEYFMLGDNTAPNTSFDSRFYGAVPRNNILGKVKTIYWPFNRIGVVN
ncbi:signal peptidase I [Pontiella agarivorans]|uniref:Signal peptidase I n=1 Tax=Pontiella agarivorans TaxID=3038953 RepID=A0ABU5MZR0_9BACT|nr:signal peptidase I [Pontiella agarivorans]MDZ8119677.1 signal peptidase I [Pontiella agarivorans]